MDGCVNAGLAKLGRSHSETLFEALEPPRDVADSKRCGLISTPETVECFRITEPVENR